MLNPYLIEVLKEEGIDITRKKTKSFFELLEAGRRYMYMITVCDETSAEACPVFPSFPSCEERCHRGFSDPSKFAGTDEEIIVQLRTLKNQIKAKIGEWLKEIDTYQIDN